METEITKFDNSGMVIQITEKLNGVVVNSKDSRQSAYDMAKKANSLKIKVDNRRKELTQPFREDKTLLIANHKRDLEAINIKILAIDDFAKEKLIKPLDASIQKAKSGIICWDTLQREIKAKEEARIERERKAEEDRLLKIQQEEEREAREAEEARLKVEREKLQAIEDEKNRKLKEAAKASGVQAAIKKRRAEKEAEEANREAEEKAEKDAQIAAEKKAESDLKLKEETDRIERESQKELAELNAKKKGREVEVVSFEIVDLNKVPREYLNLSLNTVAVKEALDTGTRKIDGIEITTKTEMKFQ